MKKRAAIAIAVAVALSGGYDFWRGYHQTQSIEGGIVFVVLGFIVLALFWYLFSKWPSE
jgi:hypothetical protein